MAINLTDLSGTIICLPEVTSLSSSYVTTYFINDFDTTAYITSVDTASLTVYAETLFYRNYK
jgi:hypothetical protein